MTMIASWVHGNAVGIQYPGGAGLEFTANSRMDQVGDHPWTDITGLRTGPGTTFRANGSDNNYFHFAIPTPVLGTTGRASLLRVFVLFNSDPDVAVVDRVYAFDGPVPVGAWGDDPAGGEVVTSSGNHDGSGGLGVLQDGITRFVLPMPHVTLWGIGVSVRVTFTRPSSITFTAAGADFDVP